LNEYTNKLIRQYIPKKEAFTKENQYNHSIDTEQLLFF
jgi:IS30 family transposase